MKKRQSGQALISLLFFALVGVIVSSAAIIIIATNTQSASKFEEGTNAYYVAESGAENAVLQLLRNPNYTGESLAIGQYSASVSASLYGNNSYIATSSAVVDNYTRKIQVILSYTNNVLSVTSWKEIP